MKISRKDTVIIAVLVNISLLAVLLATASKWEKEEEADLKPQVTSVGELLGNEESRKEVNDGKIGFLEEARPLTIYSQAVEKNPVDEIDQVLQQYALKQKVLQVAKEPEEKDEMEEVKPVVQASVTEVKNKEEAQDFFTINVKKDEVLSKIAKAHGVSVEEIMKLNALENTKLRIGQSLKIPVVKKKQSVQTAKTSAAKAPVSEIPACISQIPKKLPSQPKNEIEYYVIKDGDNPWKVARRFHLKYEDLLKLNNLDEEKARNLKIGQKIRIR